MSFYTFSQNNSGGGFNYDEHRGISHFVIIEAESVSEALDKAEDIGLYFDGEGDCPCCGYRWSGYLDEDDATDEPAIYGEAPDQYLSQPYAMKWMSGYEGFIHYADGRIEGVIK